MSNPYGNDPAGREALAMDQRDANGLEQEMRERYGDEGYYDEPAALVMLPVKCIVTGHTEPSYNGHCRRCGELVTR
jgi:hypothetical protein